MMENMKAVDLAPKQILSVSCPTCGAVPGKRCELSAGGLRNTPHRDRELSAAEALERATADRFHDSGKS
jgi:hypothetical protein